MILEKGNGIKFKKDIFIVYPTKKQVEYFENLEQKNKINVRFINLEDMGDIDDMKDFWELKVSRIAYIHGKKLYDKIKSDLGNIKSKKVVSKDEIIIPYYISFDDFVNCRRSGIKDYWDHFYFDFNNNDDDYKIQIKRSKNEIVVMRGKKLSGKEVIIRSFYLENFKIVKNIEQSIINKLFLNKKIQKIENNLEY